MLELQNISYDAEDGKEILQDISLKIDDRFVAVTGPNGGGKSTLAKLIAGINKPSAGRIFLDGEDITELSVTERANRGISYAFQQPVRFKGLRVKDLLALASGRDSNLNDSCEILSEVGLCARDYMDRELNDSLSGGEMKRIEIAMILARGTGLSVFDEPEAGIDLWSFQNLIQVFQELRRGLEGAVVVISHQERILSIADELVIVANGRVQDQGPGEKLLPKLLEGEGSGACPACPREGDAL